MPELQTSTSDLESNQSVGQVAVEWHENPLEQEQQYRAAAYGMLAALLRDVPDAALLESGCKVQPMLMKAAMKWRYRCPCWGWRLKDVPLSLSTMSTMLFLLVLGAENWFLTGHFI